jgi:hypothetical protein
LVDTILPGGQGIYVQAGSIVDDVGRPGWVPIADPLDADGIAKFFAAGPRLDVFRAEDLNRWADRPNIRPSVYWYQAGDQWFLKGHEGLGAKNT